MLQHFLNPPNWFTAASICCSTAAITLLLSEGAGPEELARACVLVILGGVFDMMDGRVARMTNRYTEFGVQLDSIADVIGFGLAPALIAWKWRLHELGVVGTGLCFWYVLCAAFRLARFNVATANQSWKYPGHSQGLTSTMAGGSLVSIIWVAGGYLENRITLSAPTAGLLVTVLACLMITSLPMRNFKDLRRNRSSRRLFGLSVAACLGGAVLLDWSMWWFIGAVLYLTIGVIDGVVVAIHQRRLLQSLLVDELEQVWEGTLYDDDVDFEEELTEDVELL